MLLMDHLSQGVVLISCVRLGQRGAWMPRQNRGASDSGRQSLNQPSSTSPPAPPCDPVAEHHMWGAGTRMPVTARASDTLTFTVEEVDGISLLGRI